MPNLASAALRGLRCALIVVAGLFVAGNRLSAQAIQITGLGTQTVFWDDWTHMYWGKQRITLKNNLSTATTPAQMGMGPYDCGPFSGYVSPYYDDDGNYIDPGGADCGTGAMPYLSAGATGTVELWIPLFPGANGTIKVVVGTSGPVRTDSAVVSVVASASGNSFTAQIVERTYTPSISHGTSATEPANGPHGHFFTTVNLGNTPGAFTFTISCTGALTNCTLANANPTSNNGPGPATSIAITMTPNGANDRVMAGYTTAAPGSSGTVRIIMTAPPRLSGLVQADTSYLTVNAADVVAPTLTLSPRGPVDSRYTDGWFPDSIIVRNTPLVVDVCDADGTVGTPVLRLNGTVVSAASVTSTTVSGCFTAKHATFTVPFQAGENAVNVSVSDGVHTIATDQEYDYDDGPEHRPVVTSLRHATEIVAVYQAVVDTFTVTNPGWHSMQYALVPGCSYWWNSNSNTVWACPVSIPSTTVTIAAGTTLIVPITYTTPGLVGVSIGVSLRADVAQGAGPYASFLATTASLLAPQIAITPASGTTVTVPHVDLAVHWCDVDGAVGQVSVTWQGQTLPLTTQSDPTAAATCASAFLAAWPSRSIDPWQQTLTATATDPEGHTTTRTATITYAPPLTVFQPTVSPKSGSHSVAANVSASETFTVTNSGIYTGAYALTPSCSGLANCAVSPGALALAPGASGTATVSYTSRNASAVRDTIKLIAKYTAPTGPIIADTGRRVAVVPALEASPVVTVNPLSVSLDSTYVSTFVYDVFNPGSEPVTVALSATTTGPFGFPNWFVRPDTMTVGPGATREVWIYTKAPGYGSEGQQGVYTLTASYVNSQGATLSGAASAIAQVIVRRPAMALRAPAGATVENPTPGTAGGQISVVASNTGNTGVDIRVRVTECSGVATNCKFLVGVSAFDTAYVDLQVGETHGFLLTFDGVPGVVSGRITVALETVGASNLSPQTATINLHRAGSFVILAVSPKSLSLSVNQHRPISRWFFVQNVGTASADVTYRAVCAMFTCTASKSGATLTANQTDSALVSFTSPSRFGADSVRFVASATVPNTAPDTAVLRLLVDTLADIKVDAHSTMAGANIERGGCLTIAAGAAAAYECGDLRLVHGLPATTTMNKTRAPTLIYNSRDLNGVVPFAADVSIAVGNDVSSVTATASTRLPGGDWVSRGSKTFDWRPEWNGDTPRRIVVPGDVSGLSTGAYQYRVEVAVTSAGVATHVADTGTMAIVNRASSWFGAGWWLDGFEQIIDYGPDQKLWVGGNGSTRLYTKTPEIDSIWTVQPTLDRPDTVIVKNGYQYRHLRNRAYVQFDLMGRHLATVNASGHATTFTYATDAPHVKRLVTIDLPLPDVSSATRQYVFGYDYVGPGSETFLSSVTPTVGPEGSRVVTIEHVAGTSRIERISSPSPDTSGVRFSYDGVGRIKERFDRRGFVTSFAYDSVAHTLIRSTVNTAPSENIVRTFCAAEAASVLACAPGPIETAKVLTWYDGPRMDVPDTTKFYLTQYGAPQTIIDALKRPTTIERKDPRWPLLATSTIQPNGFTTRATYTDRGLVATQTSVSPFDGGDAITTYSWNSNPNFDLLDQVTGPTGAITRYGYFANGDRRWQLGGGADTAWFTYNSNRMVIAVQASGNSPTQLDSMLYNGGLGNLDHTRSAMGVKTSYVGDALGRVSLVTSPVDDAQTRFRSVRTQYDVFDDPLVVVDSAQRSAIDASPLRSTVTTTYDNEGHPLSVTRVSSPDAASVGAVTTLYTYDGAGRKMSEGPPNAATQQWIYDPAGNVLKEGRADAMMTYDVLNRLIGRAGTTMDTLAYDDAGFLRLATNAYARVERTYYPSGALKTDTLRIAATDTTHGGYSHVYGTQYGYDPSGRVTSVAHPSGLRPAGVSRAGTSYVFDPTTAHLTDVVDIFGRTYRYRYDNAGRQQGLVRRFGQADSVSETAGYDLNGRLTSRVQQTAAGVTLHSDILGYDMQDRIVTVSTNDNVTYDGLGHVISSLVHGRPESFVIDALGNQAQHTTGGSSPSSETSVYEPATGRLVQRLVQSSNAAVPDTTYYEYDGVSGNRLQTREDIKLREAEQSTPRVYVRKVRTDSYDAANRLVQSRFVVDTVPSPVVPFTYMATESYRYDALGRRIWRQTLKPSTCIWVERDTGCRNTVTRFVWSGADLLYEISTPATDPENDAPSVGPHYGVIGYTHDGTLDQPIELFKGSQEVLPFTDWRGSFDRGMCGEALCDGSIYFPGSGATVYGRFNRADGPPSWFGSLIEGHQDGSGYQYRRNRYYDPKTGQFTQQDPIGLAGGMNLYGFAGADPVNYSDPFGLCPEILDHKPCAVSTIGVTFSLSVGRWSGFVSVGTYSTTNGHMGGYFTWGGAGSPPPDAHGAPATASTDGKSPSVSASATVDVGGSESLEALAGPSTQASASVVRGTFVGTGSFSWNESGNSWSVGAGRTTPTSSSSSLGRSHTTLFFEDIVAQPPRPVRPDATQVKREQP